MYITRQEFLQCLWSFETKLDHNQQAILQQSVTDSVTVKQIHELTQQFRKIVSNRQSERLADWLVATTASAIPELVSFANGIKQDFDAVLNGLLFEFSNGLLEGHVNRVKTIKRMMYGRAKFDLLRQRVLYRMT